MELGSEFCTLEAGEAATQLLEKIGSRFELPVHSEIASFLRLPKVYNPLHETHLSALFLLALVFVSCDPRG